MSKKIHITDPDFETRKGILEINAKNKPMDENCDLDKIARNLSGLNGGIIANIMNQAGILAVRKGLEKITDVKKSIGSYRFEDESLFIYLKTGQGSKNL